MNIELTKKFMQIVRVHSPSCFINSNFELIVVPTKNIYFRLEDIDTELEFQCKVLAWLSRPSCKGVSPYWQKRVRAIVNEYLGTSFTLKDMHKVYTYLGNDCNRQKTVRFIESKFDLTVLNPLTEEKGE